MSSFEAFVTMLILKWPVASLCRGGDRGLLEGTYLYGPDCWYVRFVNDSSYIELGLTVWAGRILVYGERIFLLAQHANSPAKGRR